MAQNVGARSTRPTGLVTTPGPLSPGTYSLAGNVHDAVGNIGTVTLSLVVSPPGPSIARVVGHAIVGGTTSIVIRGTGFFGRPTVTGPRGMSALVTRDTGTQLTVRVSVVRGARRGAFVLVVTLPNRLRVATRYIQR